MSPSNLNMVLSRTTLYVLIVTTAFFETAFSQECWERDEVAAGRRCKRACHPDGSCRKQNKECVCDGLCGPSCFYKRCPPLTEPMNGSIEINPTDRTIGAEVTYSCRNGYVISGQPTRVCQANKTWSGTEPTCTESTTRENDIDMQVLATLTEDDLREIGVKSFGLRRKLKIVCEEMKKSDVLPVPDTDQDSYSTASSLDGSMDTSDDDICLARLATQPATSTPKRNMVPLASRNVKSSLSSDIVLAYNLKQVMEENSEGEKVDEHLTKGGVPSSQQRRLLVKLAVACMVESVGLYPSSRQKTALAKEIVKTYPSTRDTTPGMKGHEHFYDNGHGFIEYRLKNMRMSRPQEEKKRQRSSKAKQLSCPRAIPGKLYSQSGSQDTAQDIDAGEKLNWMKYMPPTYENQAKHRQYLNETFQHRRAIIEGPSSLTITDILQKFPRFQDMPELINMEFQMMFPETCDNFVTKWETSFKEQLITLGQAEYPAVQILIEHYQEGDRNICALSALTYILHRSVNMTKGKAGKSSSSSRSDALQYLIQNVPEGTDVGEAAKEKKDRFKQPFLLSLGPERNPKQFFIVLDRIAVPGGLNVVDAMDRLFKCHYVFNVEYCPCLQQFWEFIASMVYEILPPYQAKPQVRALGAAIRAPTKQ